MEKSVRCGQKRREDGPKDPNSCPDRPRIGHSGIKRLRAGQYARSRPLDDAFFRPSLAHGQWVVALNRENSSVNAELSAEINNLDVVELYRRKYSLLKLERILEDIIESPDRAHHKDYWVHLVELEDKEAELASWTMAKKVAAIKAKASFVKK